MWKVPTKTPITQTIPTYFFIIDIITTAKGVAYHQISLIVFKYSKIIKTIEIQKSKQPISFYLKFRMCLGKKSWVLK